MKRIGLIILAAVFVSSLAGCGKKEAAQEQMPEQASIESLGIQDTETKSLSEVKPQVQETQSLVTAAVSEVKTEATVSSGLSKPTAKEIQAALKNAGYYLGNIDGKIGPQTRKAAEEFQKANNLKADGRVGLKTWTVLSKYLSTEPQGPARKHKKKR